MIKNYFKIAWRSLKKNSAYSVINIVGFSIGLAAAMTIMLFLRSELNFDRFHTKATSIYRVVMNDGENHTGSSGLNEGPKFAAGIPEIESFVRVQGAEAEFRNRAELNYESKVLLTDNNFFSMFTFPLLYGDSNTALVNPGSVVLSESAAKKYFGTTAALGKTLQVKKGANFEVLTVTGVARNVPINSSIKFDFVVPMGANPKQSVNADWGNYYLNTFVTIRDGSDIKAIESKMKNIFHSDARDLMTMLAEKNGGKPSMIRYSLQPLTKIHLNEASYSVANGLSGSSNPIFSYVLSGIALFILLIASINFINLALARSLSRVREVGLRKIIGASRKQLIIQFLGESMFLCFISFLLAVFLVQLVLPFFNGIFNLELSLKYLFDWKLLAGYILLFVFTGILAGFYPALVVSGLKPIRTISGRGTSFGKNGLQKNLIVLQFTLASFLIIATLTIYTQFNYIINKPLGYDFDHVVVIQKKNLQRDEVILLKQQVTKNADILEVSLKNGGDWEKAAKINGNKDISFHYETIDESFLPLYRIPIVSGRNFSPQLATDSAQSVLVNESFVKQAGWDKPIGQQIDFNYENNRKYTVVGVVKDYNFLDLSKKIAPQVFTMKPDNQIQQILVRIKPGTETSSLGYLKQTFKNLFPTSVYMYQFKSDAILKAYESEAKWKDIILFSAIFTIFISCIGLFGLAALSAQRKVKEIGIRKVLGATVSSIVRQLSIGFIKLVLIAIVVASPFAWLVMNKWLEGFAYRVDVSWWMFGATALILITIALLTVSSQAIRAALSNPVKSLKGE